MIEPVHINSLYFHILAIAFHYHYICIMILFLKISIVFLIVFLTPKSFCPVDTLKKDTF
jgi:hypothetical protein